MRLRVGAWQLLEDLGGGPSRNHVFILLASAHPGAGEGQEGAPASPQEGGESCLVPGPVATPPPPCSWAKVGGSGAGRAH